MGPRGLVERRVVWRTGGGVGGWGGVGWGGRPVAKSIRGTGVLCGVSCVRRGALVLGEAQGENQGPGGDPGTGLWVYTRARSPFLGQSKWECPLTRFHM